jgi:hypothetical protein
MNLKGHGGDDNKAYFEVHGNFGTHHKDHCIEGFAVEIWNQVVKNMRQGFFSVSVG